MSDTLELRIKELEAENIALKSELKSAKTQLESCKDQNFFLYAILENTPDPVFIKDANSRHLLANAATLKVIGKPSDAVIGKCDSELYEDPEIGRTIQKTDARIMKSGRTEVVEEKVMTPEGIRMFLSTKTPLRDASGNIIGLFGIAQDITQLRETERRLLISDSRLKRLIESDIIGVVICRENGDLVEVNDYYLKMLGYTREEYTSRNLKWTDVTPQEFVSYEIEKLTQFKNTGNWQPYEKQFRRKDGSIVWALVGPIPIEAEASKDQEYLVIVLDITESKDTELSLRRSEHKLKTLNENLESIIVSRTEQVRQLSKALTLAEQNERKRFSYILHDDLQQILFAAKFRAEMVELHFVSNKNDSSYEITTLLQLLSKAIDTTRAVAIELNPPILENQGLDAALNWLSNHMKERYDLIICIDISEELSSVKGSDQVLIIQLVRELLFNIVKHAKTKDVVLTGHLSGNMVKITIGDKGVGFDVQSVRHADRDKPGMGLFSIQERLHLFGGNLEIDSTLGKGTYITISMPARTVA